MNFGFTPDFEIFDSLYVEENLEAVKTLCLCRLFTASTCLLDREALDCYLKLNEKFTGLKRNFTNEELVVLFLNEYIPNYLGKVWCEEYCSEEIIADVENLCNNILSNYKKEICYNTIHMTFIRKLLSALLLICLPLSSCDVIESTSSIAQTDKEVILSCDNDYYQVERGDYLVLNVSAYCEDDSVSKAVTFSLEQE